MRAKKTKVLHLTQLPLFGEMAKPPAPKKTKAQRIIDEIKEGARLRDEGIELSKDNANRKEEGWSGEAYMFLKVYIKKRKKFTIEEIRIASKEFIVQPPDQRAWGAVMVKAIKAGLVERIGYTAGQLKQCHRGPKAIWKVMRKKFV